MTRLRTFIALDLGSEVRRRLVSWQGNLTEAGAKVKWVEPENLHVTLLFLGEVDQRALIGVCRAVQDAARKVPAFGIRVEGVGAFPNARRPRVIWAGVGEGAEDVGALHGALEQSLLELGEYRREDRKFTPHITLGRIKSERCDPALEEVFKKDEVWKAGEVAIQEVHVMSSELTRAGPVYTVLSRAPLG